MSLDKKDPELLRGVFGGDYNDPVLVTGDDHMPDDHAGLVASLGCTIATIRPGDSYDPLEDLYEREIVHRWAHQIQEQPTGTIRRYSLIGSRTWTTRKR